MTLSCRKNTSALLHRIITENKLKSHEKVCKNNDFCGIVMPSEKVNILNLINL